VWQYFLQFVYKSILITLKFIPFLEKLWNLVINVMTHNQNDVERKRITTDVPN